MGDNDFVLDHRHRNGYLRGGMTVPMSDSGSGQLSRGTVVKVRGAAKPRGSRCAVAIGVRKCSLSGCRLMAGDGLTRTLAGTAA